jgi:hypothetical protein
VVDADEILVLDAGRIVERGNHWDLLAANGTYARMWRLQQDEDRERGDDKALAAEAEATRLLEASAAGPVVARTQQLNH